MQKFIETIDAQVDYLKTCAKRGKRFLRVSRSQIMMRTAHLAYESYLSGVLNYSHFKKIQAYQREKMSYDALCGCVQTSIFEEFEDPNNFAPIKTDKK